MRHAGTIAASLLVATALLSSCGDDVATAGGQTGTATARGLAAVAIEHITKTAKRTRGEYSEWGDPAYVAADVDYGVDPEGTENGRALTVRLRLSRLSDLSAKERERLTCQPEQQERGGCDDEKTDGGTLVYAWEREAPEEEPGYASYTFVHDDEIAFAQVESSEIKTDPRSATHFPLDLDQLRAIVLDPDFTFAMNHDTVAAGKQIPSYTGPESPPDKPAAGRTEPEELAAEVIRYADFTPSAAGPSTLDVLGPDAVGAHLKVPAKGRWSPATVDILTVAGKAPIVDPMPCTKLNRQVRLDDGSMCFAWSKDNVIRWAKATAHRPGVIWILGYHDNETYNRVDTVAIKISTPDLTFDLFGPSDSTREVPNWWWNVGELATAMNISPNSEDPSDHPTVPNWHD
ncbi:MAG: hypothetical protein QM655_02065 [Nocardioidaceae bacterium]